MSLNIKDDIAESAQGSFYIAQMLAYDSCIAQEITEAAESKVETLASFPLILGAVYERLSRTFRERTERFASGPRFRKEGRAPYLHLLYWLATSEDWTLSITKAVRAHPEIRGSITQIAEKGYLATFLSGDEEMSSVLHFDQQSQLLTIEDPQYLFFLRNTYWSRFASEVGFLDINFPGIYDFALSFSGADREIAQRLFELLQERELEVFYDLNEQHRLLATDVEDYLRPIYQSDASYVVVLLGPSHPQRIWTKFESDAFRERFGDGDVVPVWFSNAPPGMFDTTRQVGGVTLIVDAPLAPQLQDIANLLAARVAEDRAATP